MQGALALQIDVVRLLFQQVALTGTSQGARPRGEHSVCKLEGDGMRGTVGSCAVKLATALLTNAHQCAHSLAALSADDPTWAHRPGSAGGMTHGWRALATPRKPHASCATLTPGCKGIMVHAARPRGPPCTCTCAMQSARNWGTTK